MANTLRELVTALEGTVTGISDEVLDAPLLIDDLGEGFGYELDIDPELIDGKLIAGATNLVYDIRYPDED